MKGSNLYNSVGPSVGQAAQIFMPVTQAPVGVSANTAAGGGKHSKKNSTLSPT